MVQKTDEDTELAIASDTIQYDVDNTTLVPTNYGVAFAVVKMMYQKMSDMLLSGTPPTKEDIQYFLQASLKVRTRLTQYGEVFYQKKESK